jgi:hypothetical protein
MGMTSTKANDTNVVLQQKRKNAYHSAGAQPDVFHAAVK